MCLGFAVGLFAGPERKRLSKLYGYSAQEWVDVVHTADMTRSSEVSHIERVVRAILGDAETGGYPLPVVGTAFVCVACEGRSRTGYVNHLPLCESVVEVFGEPNGPIIS